MMLHRGIVTEINIKVWEVLKHYRDRDKISTVHRKNSIIRPNTPNNRALIFRLTV